MRENLRETGVIDLKERVSVMSWNVKGLIRNVAGVVLAGIVMGTAVAQQQQPQPLQNLTQSGEKFIAGDALKITLPLDSNSFLAGVYPIDREGYVNLPIYGKYKVTSSSPGEFAAYVQKTYEQYLRYPEVQTTPLIRVSLLGGFARPGMYYVDSDRSLWDLVSLAGGTTYEHGLKKLRWERDRKEIRADLMPYLESGQSLKNIGLQSGDQIWTPSDHRSFWDVMLHDVLPVTTFALSLWITVNDRNN